MKQGLCVKLYDKPHAVHLDVVEVYLSCFHDLTWQVMWVTNTCFAQIDAYGCGQ